MRLPDSSSQRAVQERGQSICKASTSEGKALSKAPEADSPGQPWMGGRMNESGVGRTAVA